MGFTRTADRLVEGLILDMWPQGPAVYVDYGLNEENYRAFQIAVKLEGVTANQLHAACGSSAKLSALIKHPIKLLIDFDEMAEV
jgi:hypothetical protein